MGPFSQDYGKCKRSIIGIFKFGGMVRYRHTNMHVEKKVVNLNLAVERHTKFNSPPNFRLYDNQDIASSWC